MGQRRTCRRGWQKPGFRAEAAAAGDPSADRAATCMQPQVKGLAIMVNSQYNGWRMEDVWLDR
jgi:hypothetical protein